MPANTLVSISYCCDHRKGGDASDAHYVHPQTHAEWLSRAMDLYQAAGFPVVVACTGFQGMTKVPNAPDRLERDVMWSIFAKAHIVGVPDNPGHQVGAALCIRQGLECAAKLGYRWLIHTAEDVLPGLTALTQMTAALEVGYDYAGEAWGERADQLNAQFFGCRVATLEPPFDPGAMSGNCIEAYLKRVLEGRQLWLTQQYYRHTHDYGEWQRWRKEQGS